VKALIRWCLPLAALFGTAPLLAQTSSFKFLGAHGPYAVGLNVVEQHDRSRTFPCAPQGVEKSPRTDCARPLQTLVWYPSSGDTGEPMTVGDYARLADTEIHSGQPGVPSEWESKLGPSAGVRLWAIRDAPLAAGHFPIAIYAPGQSSVAWDNADLCEYLASHGYVVLASPSMGESTRDADDRLGDVDAQARDISFLAVAGWSWGGLSNLFAAARDSRIKALVAFDGSLRYCPGLVEKAGDVHPERMTLPLLFFTRGDLSLEDWDSYHGVGKEGPNVLNAWTHGDLWDIRMLGMLHPGFASMYQRAQGDRRFAENQVADYGRDDVNASYAWVARYTLGFLDAYLKADAPAMAFLGKTPAENGVAEHFMSSSFRMAQPLP